MSHVTEKLCGDAEACAARWSFSVGLDTGENGPSKVWATNHLPTSPTPSQKSIDEDWGCPENAHSPGRKSGESEKRPRESTKGQGLWHDGMLLPTELLTSAHHHFKLLEQIGTVSRSSVNRRMTGETRKVRQELKQKSVRRYISATSKCTFSFVEFSWSYVKIWTEKSDKVELP